MNVLSLLSLLSRAREGVRLDRVSNDGYKSCRGLRIYSQALLWNSASCRRRVQAFRSLSDLSLALSSNATTLNHLIRLRGSQGIQIWKQRTERVFEGRDGLYLTSSAPTFEIQNTSYIVVCFRSFWNRCSFSYQMPLPMSWSLT